jgi:OOP family OmpA-OmpF porin
MKISSLGKVTLGSAVFALAGTAFANVTPNLTDSQGAAVKDASGACVVTSGVVHPDCAGAKPAGSRPARRAREARGPGRSRQAGSPGGQARPLPPSSSRW